MISISTALPTLTSLHLIRVKSLGEGCNTGIEVDKDVMGYKDPSKPKASNLEFNCKKKKNKNNATIRNRHRIPSLRLEPHLKNPSGETYSVRTHWRIIFN